MEESGILNQNYLLLHLIKGNLIHMDFSNEKYATIDEKGRAIFPAEFKDAMGGTIPDGKIAIEMDPYEKCLNLYPMDAWDKRISLVKSKLNRNNPKQARLLDAIYRRFKIVPVAKNGRLNFPNHFLTEMGITKEIVFVGVGDRIRTWDSKEYEKYYSDMDDFRTIFAENFGDEEA